MKRTFTLLFLAFGVFCAASALGQDNFSDDFESYEVGDYLAENAPQWTTWSGSTGGSEDVRITDDQASSGTNSIFFEAPGMSGGPQDVVLPFGGLRTDGIFDFSMMVYIPADGSGYFNFQGDQTVGETWAMDCYIEDNGRLSIGTGQTVQLVTDYNKQEWFEIRIRADLTNNLWSLYIDGECLGAFSNPTNRVSHLDLFPLSGDAFYVDDVSYTYEADAPTISRDVAIAGIEWGTGRLAGTSSSLDIGLKNNVGSTITSAMVNIDYNGAQFTETLTDLTIEEGETYWFTTSETFTLTVGANDFKATVMSVNGMNGDDFSCNDFRNFGFEAVEPAPNKSVLVEEGTGTWCQWCPRGAVYMDLMYERYPDHFVPVAVHNEDPMDIGFYDFNLQNLPGFSGYPSVVVNRDAVTDPSTMENPFLERVSESTSAKLTNEAEYDDQSRELTITVTADFMEDLSGDYRLLAVVTEDSVTGTGSGYAQVNAYAGGGFGPMGGYENLPDPVPADQMVYQYVARALLPGFVGDDSSLPDQISAGSSESVQFTYTVPQSHDTDHLNIVSVLLRPDRTVENSKHNTLDELLNPTAIERPGIRSSISLQPNPASASTQLNIELDQRQDVTIDLISSNGSVVRSRDYGTLHGAYTFPIQLDGLSPGMYFLRVKTQDGQALKKLIVTP